MKKESDMEATDKPSIVIVCPVYNESENINIFFEKFKPICETLKSRYNISFLFADNRSTDDTFQKLKILCQQNSNVRNIRYSRNFGVMKSIYTALINADGNAAAVFDCDLQDPPELLLKFVESWEKGAKVVYGVRMKRDESFIMKVFRNGYRRLKKICNSNKTTLESGAWFLDERVIDEIRHGSRFEPYLAGLIERIGFKSVGIPYERAKRRHGKSKFNKLSYFSYAADSLVSGSIVPLRLSLILGFIFSLGSFVLMIYFIIAKLCLALPFASGVAATIVITLFGFGVNFIFVGIIGEYVGRVYMERELSAPAIIDVDMRSLE